MIDDKELTCQKLYAKYHRAYFLECCGFEKRFPMLLLYKSFFSSEVHYNG